MLPPSAKDLMNIGQSKYAVVVATAQRARALSETKKNEESYRLSGMITEALDDIIEQKVVIVNDSEPRL
ncbi:MAG TPA: DNA-directed RNA polymerase subunit omega [Syntrophomonadaceae bacterium]|nr:DNA-directed RNA polymerase subunit omega [Syntrophomonadaceae bacterium]